MATKEEINDIIFGGGLTPDVELPEEEVIVPKDFDMLGNEVNAVEDNEESLQDDEEDAVLEEDDTPSKSNKKPSVTALLMQQVEQNKFLMEQLLSKGNSTQNNPVDQQALDAGRALLNMQSQNPVLYNKVNAFVANELSGNQTNSQINGKLSTLKQMLKGEAWKNTDTSPFFDIIDAVELSENNTKKENQQLISVLNNLQREVNGLKEHKENSFKQTVEAKENQALVSLKKAEFEFGVKLKKGSDEAKDFVLLVQNGKDPRVAFMKAMSLRETDKVKRGKPKEVDLNPKVEMQKTPANRVASQLFPEKRHLSGLFKK